MTDITTTPAESTWTAVPLVIPVYWPAQLPQTPLRRGFNSQTVDNVIRSPMTGGAPKERRRYTQDLHVVTIPLLLTRAQFTTFKAFITQYSAAAFIWKDFEDSPPSDAIYTVTQPPTKTQLSPQYWRVTMTCLME